MQRVLLYGRDADRCSRIREEKEMNRRGFLTTFAASLVLPLGWVKVGPKKIFVKNGWILKEGDI